MATAYPGALDTTGSQLRTDIASTDDLDASGKQHDVMHVNAHGAVVALETKLGLTDSNAAANAVLVGTGTSTTAWTTSPTIGGDLTVSGNCTIQSLDMDTLVAGDVLYASGADTLARLAKGSDDEVLTLASGIPSWAAASSSAPTNATAEVTTMQSTTSGTYTDLTTAGPTVTLATGTKALVLITALLDPSTASGANLVFYVGCDITSATTQAPDGSNFDSLAIWPRGAAMGIRATAAVLFTGLTAGSNVFKLMYRSGDGSSTGYFRSRQIAVIDMGS